MTPLDHFILLAREMTARQQLINAGRRLAIRRDCLGSGWHVRMAMR